ncbi:flagellar hook-associated protein FlgK [Clostridium cylindrosporum]|uniref:Flagellar hook-associated protein 1 n=1 Tax=Clostridium cylindrosporum DSM 605 TaxID=1121307 RepID=A0A0J8D725_CLOCY|nr:flagellar hook-associated protein FlgK [Clostridium cylindrosporum]KMT21687.1 flagellar hook-associated protein 1 [Clostridium cylindrosporum DSM 605]
MSGLFYTFSIAKRGMAAQQTSLHVTSHNVSNSNTIGYSKQRATHKTTDPFPMPALNNPVGPGQLGTGVEVSEITRARDEFIDNSIRRETSNLLTYSSRDQFLNSIESIINEPGDTGLSNSLTKFWDAWQGLSTNPENATSRKLVVSNATALGDSFRQTYTQLEELEKDLSQLQRDHIFSVNSILNQVSELNEQIKQITINGQMPNDLMDRRDALLDNLSEHINFKVEKGDFNSIRVVTKDPNGNERYLVADSKVINGVAAIDDVSFKIGAKDIDKSSFPLNINKTTDIPISSPKITFKVYIDGDINKPSIKTVDLTEDNIKKYFNVEYIDSDNIRIDSIKDANLLYNKGTKDISQAIQNAESFDFANGAIKGLEKQKVEISDYKNQINDMARTIVIAVNTIHSNDNTKNYDKDKNNYINFFEDIVGSNHPAASLKVNEVIVKDVSKINAGSVIQDKDIIINTVTGETQKPDSGDNYRAKRIAELRNIRLDVANIKNSNDFIKQAYDVSSPTFTGNLAKDPIIQSSSGDTVDTYYKGMVAELGVSAQEAKRVVENQENLIQQLDIQRQAVSGVSVDEEMIDMLQFQRAYQANAKMINVVDELLDVVVNGLKR